MFDQYQQASSRVTVKRGADRAVYGRAEVHAILDAGHIAHVGVETDNGPIVLPMAYGVRMSEIGDEVLIHGSVANAMLRAGRELDVCATVTIVDGLAVARAPFHNSINYRSVVVRGTATAITDADDKFAALQIINDHIAPIWDTARPPSESDLNRTFVLALPLTKASAKVRSQRPEVRQRTPPTCAALHWSPVRSPPWPVSTPTRDHPQSRALNLTTQRASTSCLSALRFRFQMKPSTNRAPMISPRRPPRYQGKSRFSDHVNFVR